jgi:hypothetical protein
MSRPRAGSGDERDAFQRIAQAGAVDVNDVQGRAGDGRRADDFFDGLDRRTRLDAACAPHVGIHRQLALGSYAEHVDHLEPRGPWDVLNAHADAERAGVELIAQALLNVSNLFGGGRFVGRGSAFRQDGAVR